MDRIVVFLNGARGIASLSAVVSHGHAVSLVVIPEQTDATLADQVLAMGLRCMPLADVNEETARAQLQQEAPNLFLIAGYSQIFSAALIAIPRLGTLNLHAGRLPQYRGGSPLNWQMINAERAAGLSVIQIDLGIDTGNILAEAEIEITPITTIASLHNAANHLFPELVLKAIAEVESGVSGQVQDEALAVYWHQRNDLDGRFVPQAMTVNEVSCWVRALTRPYPGAWCVVEGYVVRVISVQMVPYHLRGTPGRICYIQGEGPLMLCRDGAVKLTEWYVEGQSRDINLNGKIVDSGTGQPCYCSAHGQ